MMRVGWNRVILSRQTAICSLTKVLKQEISVLGASMVIAVGPLAMVALALEARCSPFSDPVAVTVPLFIRMLCTMGYRVTHLPFPFMVGKVGGAMVVKHEWRCGCSIEVGKQHA